MILLYKKDILSIAVTLSSVALLLMSTQEIKEQQHENKMLRNQIDSFIINYERSSEDIHYTLEDYKYRLREAEGQAEQLQNELEQAQETIQENEQEMKGLNAEIEKLKKRASTVSVAPSYKFTASEINLLQRLVEAEAGGESIEGRIAVANVVLNRIKSTDYPNTLTNVIYQHNQFEVVNLGTIDTKVPSAGTVEAVNRALAGEQVVPEGTVIFWAKYLNKNHPIWSHNDIVATIGVHHFSKGWK